jgi:hypothetical protein
VLVILKTIISLIKVLAKRFINNFNGILTLINIFRAFNIIKIFFFNISLIDFIYTVDNFFITGLVFLRFFIN